MCPQHSLSFPAFQLWLPTSLSVLTLHRWQAAFDAHKAEAAAALSALREQHSAAELACARSEETVRQLQTSIELVTNQKKMQVGPEGRAQ